jgi:hypothetical protein
MAIWPAALVALPALVAQAPIPRQCPLIVSPSQAEIQPLRIKPSQVNAKNARGCLSPSDAVYGTDGCPRRLCGPEAGVIQLPEP